MLKWYNKFLLFFFGSVVLAQAIENTVAYEVDGISYTRNSYGDIFPRWQDIPPDILGTKLSSFITLLKDSFNKIPFIVEIPHSHTAVLTEIQKAGFTIYAADHEKTVWIFKNSSSIPDAYNATIGAGVVIRKNNDVLVVEEKTRRGMIGFPGGTSEKRELVRITAAREIKEEVGLVIAPEELKLFAAIHRVRANQFNANGIDHYYVIDHDKAQGTLKLDNDEIVHAFYVPLKDIVVDNVVNGLKVSPAHAALARFLLDEKSYSHHEIHEDFRQFLKRESDKDPHDTMTIEFFA